MDVVAQEKDVHHPASASYIFVGFSYCYAASKKEVLLHHEKYTWNLPGNTTVVKRHAFLKLLVGYTAYILLNIQNTKEAQQYTNKFLGGWVQLYKVLITTNTS